MRYLIFSDVHWNTSSSLVRSIGDFYSTRLEYLLKSMNWVNKVAVENNCQAMICAGDFMDRSDLTDEEITALKDIVWNNLPCYCLCGNHESSVNDLRFSTVKALESPTCKIINKPYILKDDSGREIRFLPYVTESDRKALSEYFETSGEEAILISHNDIQGINYGGYISTIGFPVDELAQYKLVLNGHLHNTSWVKPDKVLNVGSIMAHNFTNDSSRYAYGVWILDADKATVEFIENPYGSRMYKFDIMTDEDIEALDIVKENAVLSVRCKENLLEQANAALNKLAPLCIVHPRVTVCRDLSTLASDEGPVEEFTSDYVPKFCTFIKATLGETDVVLAELAEVCK